MRAKLLVGVFIALTATGLFFSLPFDPSDSTTEAKLESQGFDQSHTVGKNKTARHLTSSVARQDILAISRKIDELASRLVTDDDSTNGTISDNVFVRRVYLDIAGRIPTYREFTEFAASKGPEKRERLIDRLLDSEAHVSRQFNFFADLLRIQSRNRIGSNQPYIDYIKESIRENKPIDQWVREMLTASGALMKRGNGAVGYLMRDYGMPEDSMSNTIRVFLGTRLECAQCHNHPTDEWTQRQYFEMVAFFGGVHHHLVKTESEFDDQLVSLSADPKLSVDMKRFTRQVIVPMRYGVIGNGKGIARLPAGYQYADGDENEVVHARTLFDEQQFVNETLPEEIPAPRTSMNIQYSRHDVRGAKQINSRKRFAEWLTSPDNRRFSVVLANRFWKQALGLGVVEPVDNITRETFESQPELLDFLSKTLVSLDFDSKQLLRAIYYSKTYQQPAVRIDNPVEATGQYAKPLFSRMSSEQVWDSLLTLTKDNVDEAGEPLCRLPNFLGLTDVHEAYDRLVELSPDEIKQVVVTNMKLRENNPDYPRHVFRIDGRPAIYRQDQIYRELDGDESELLRASDLFSPMPPDHLLRELGQSNRDSINNGNLEIATTQLLSLMNGFVEERISGNAESLIMKTLTAKENEKQQIEVAYLSVLGRQPTDGEIADWLEEYKRYGQTTAADLVWTLTNSTEFLFVQ